MSLTARVQSEEESSAWQVFLIFLRLGLTSFGGPVAHLGYFREEFVSRRRWLSDHSYTDLVALCQFLPGPASSQVGLALGLSRAGYAGALAAWLRSEEHTSELQSLMRISYAVFCLKKKKKQQTDHSRATTHE